ncbi:hypothetical protein E2I00_007286, partial [Balaenoptera physalus]
SPPRRAVTCQAPTLKRDHVPCRRDGGMGRGAWQQERRPLLCLLGRFAAALLALRGAERDATPPDKTLKCTVYRVRGPVSAGNYIQLPKTSTQSLGLTGRYLYVLFRPLPAKHFVIHLDLCTEVTSWRVGPAGGGLALLLQSPLHGHAVYLQDNQVIRVSFSNFFKEFKSTATWLQFPFICETGTPRKGVGSPGARWTCLQLDLHDILLVYLNRRYSQLKSIRLCASLLVRNLYTSDLCFDPAVTVAEARRAKLPIIPIPREMAFPVPKGESWHDHYVHVRLVCTLLSGFFSIAVLAGPVPRLLPHPAAFSKLVQDSLALMVQKHGPTASRQAPSVPRPLPEVSVSCERSEVCSVGGPSGRSQEPLAWVKATDKHVVSDSLHVSARQTTVEPTAPEDASPQESFLPDPVLRLKGVIGFGGHSTKWALWTRDGAAVVYPCHAVIVVLCVNTREQRLFLGHTDKVGTLAQGWLVLQAHTLPHPAAPQVSALALDGNGSLLASAQARPHSMLRLWDFQTGECLSLFQSPVHTVCSLSFSDSGEVLCGPGIAISSLSVSQANSVRISPDGLRVLSTTSSGHLGFLDILSREYSVLVRSHAAPVLALATECSRGQLATVSQDHTVRIWDLATLQQLYDFASPEEAPCAVAFHPTQPTFFCGFSSGAVRSFSLEATEVLVEHRRSGTVQLRGKAAASRVCRCHRGAITGLAASPDGSLLFSSCSRGSLAQYHSGAPRCRILRVAGLTSLPRLKVSESLCPPFPKRNGDSRLLAFVGPSKYTVTVMDTTSLDEVGQLEPSLCAVMVRTRAALPQLLRVDISTLDLAGSRLDSAVAICFGPAPPGHLLVSTSSNMVAVLDATSGRLVRELSCVPPAACSVLALSGDGRFLLTAADRAIKVWNYSAQAGPGCQVYIGHSEPVRAVAFTADQQQLLSVGDAIFLWDVLAPSEKSPPGRQVPALDMHLPGLPLHPSAPPDHLSCHLCSVQGSPGAPPTCEAGPPRTMMVRAGVLGGPGGDVRLAPILTCFAAPGLGEGQGHGGTLLPRLTVSPLSSGAFSMWPKDRPGCPWQTRDGHLQGKRRAQGPCWARWVMGHGSSVPFEPKHLTSQGRVLASASGRSSTASRCQIRVWDVPGGSCRQLLSHHDTAVQALAFSPDDRLLVTLGDYGDRTLALWSTATYELVSSTCLPEPVHGVAFNPWDAGELACVGQGAVTLWLLQQRGGDVSLQVGGCELTSLCYGTTPLLYCGSNAGQVCVWDMCAGRCFLAWDADDGEIGVLLCSGARLVSGSNTRRLRLWAVGAVPELRRKGSGVRSSSEFMERELTLDGAVVSAVFHESMDMGVVGTTAGTLWYVSWAEGTSTRLISGHRSKVNEVVFSPSESHCATCSDDGSVRVWRVASMELLIQFQVLSQQRVAAGYSDGTLRLFSIPRIAMELKMHPHSAALTAIAFSADGQTILSGDKDGLVAVSRPRTGMTFRVLSDHRGAPICTIQSTRREVPSCLPPSLAAFCPWDEALLVCAGLGVHHEVVFYSLRQKQARAPLHVVLRDPGLGRGRSRGHGNPCPVPHACCLQVMKKIPLPFFAVSMSLSPGAHLMAIGFSGLPRLLGCSSRRPTVRYWCGKSQATDPQWGVWGQ